MSQIKTFSRFFLGLLVRILACALIGTVLLTAVYCIPTDRIDANVARSATVFEKEGTYPQLFSWCTSQLDNFTDAIILQHAAYDTGEDPLHQAMTAARGSFSDVESPADALVQHYTADNREYDTETTYHRYWHGYLLYTKPLLFLTSYQTVRIVNGIVQTALLAFLLFLMAKKGLKAYILPYLISFAFLMPLTLAMSLQFSSCYYVLTLGSIALLLAGEKLEAKEATLFLYIGIATAYFDFLTYPIATLGIPAVFYCLIKKDMPVAETLGKGIKLCFSWAVGYLGMWSSKWLLGGLLTGVNVFADAFGKISERATSGATQDTGILTSLYSNIVSFLKTPATGLAALFVLVLLVLLALALRRKKLPLSQVGRILFPFLVLACLPIVWYAATSNHSAIHYFFTHKGLAVSAFAGLAALTQLYQSTKA